MRRGLLLVSLALLASCRRYQHVDVKAKLVEVRPDGIVVEVTAKPGMLTDVGVTLKKGQGKLVPESGKVQVSLGRAQWKWYDGNRVQIVAEKTSLFTRESGWTDAPLPVSVKALDKIPKDEDLWFTVVSGGGKWATGATSVIIDGDDKLTTYLTKEKSTLELLVSTPADAELVVGGKTLEVESTGLTPLELDKRTVILNVETRSLTGRAKSSIPVTVTRDKEKTDAKIELGFDHADEPIRREILLLEEGKTFPAKGPARDTVLIVPYDGDVVAVGAMGKLGESRFVAIEHEKKREGGSCMYSSFSLTRRFVDVELRVYDSRTGKQVASHKFDAPYVDCPEWANSNDSLTWRKDFAVVKEWTEKALKSEFK